MKKSKKPSRKGGDKEAKSNVRKGSSPVCYADSDELRPGFQELPEGKKEPKASGKQTKGGKKGKDKG